MGNVGYPVQGVVNVVNVQGNYLAVPMTFVDLVDAPIDLTVFTDIRMEIKNDYNVNEVPFKVWTVGAGLTISGVGNNVLTFVLDEDFWDTQSKVFVYDIVFKKASGERYTYIKGTISNILTASRV